MFSLITFYDFISFKMTGIMSNIDFTTKVILMVVFSIMGYLIGSLNFSVLISKIKYHDDVRNHGSHNAGATNMLRSYSVKDGIVVMLLDMLKAVFTVMLTQAFIGEGAACVAGLFCIIGHCWPIYYKFKGGKGVASAFGMVIAIEPFTALVCVLVFVIIVVGTKYISLGSISAAMFVPIFVDSLYPYTHLVYAEIDGKMGVAGRRPDAFIIIPMVILTFIIVFKHRANIQRLIKGEENKFSLKKKKEGEDQK